MVCHLLPFAKVGQYIHECQWGGGGQGDMSPHKF